MAEEAKKEEKKGFVKEFKEFISKGNVVDMAVGIIIGSAFTAIVTSLVEDIIMPLVGYVTGGVDFTEFKITFPAVVEGLNPATINYGNFIQVIINFLLTALAVFFLVKGINKARKKTEVKPAEPAADVKLLTEIRDLLKEQAGK